MNLLKQFPLNKQHSHSGDEWRKVQVTPVTIWMTPKLQSSSVSSPRTSGQTGHPPLLSSFVAPENIQAVVAPSTNWGSRKDSGRCLPPGLSTFVRCSGLDLEASLTVGRIRRCRNVEVLTRDPVRYRIRASRRHGSCLFKRRHWPFEGREMKKWRSLQLLRPSL